MWRLYILASKLSERPSDLVSFWLDPWTALQFDNAVVMVGLALENALQEMQNVGDEKNPKHRPKYSLDQLLDPEFRLPAQMTEQERKKAGLKAMMAMAKSKRGIGYRKVSAKKEQA